MGWERHGSEMPVRLRERVRKIAGEVWRACWNGPLSLAPATTTMVREKFSFHYVRSLASAVLLFIIEVSQVID